MGVVEVVQFGGENVDKNKFVASAEDIRSESRAPATRFIKQITLYTNNKYVNGAQMAAAIALAIAERIIVNIATKVGPPHSEERKKFIFSVYSAAEKDALIELNKLEGPVAG